MSKKETQIGDYWLSQRPGRSAWHRTWLDRSARQTRRASLGTDDLREARLKLAEWVSRHATMYDEPIKETALETILVRYWTNHASQLKSARAQKLALKAWSDFFAGAMISELTIDRQEQFVASLRRDGMSSSYIKKILGAGRAALRRAYERQEIGAPPAIIRVTERNPVMRRLEIGEVRALIEASHQTPHLEMFVMLALNTLSRPGALLELTRFQCDLDRRLIYLNPEGREQTKKRRPIVPITGTLYPYVEKAPAGPLVQFRGKSMASIKTAWRKGVARAGLGNDVVPMTLRRTMARELRRRGVQPWDVAGIMGHSMDERTTEIYAEYDPSFQKKAIEAIDAYMSEVLNSADACQLRIQLVGGQGFKND